MSRRHRPDEACEARPGYVLSYRGGDLGVVERVEGETREPGGTMHVRGGISGSLEYVIPASAVVSVQPYARRAEVDGQVSFASQRLANDDRVLMVAQLPAADHAHQGQPRTRPHSGWIGSRVDADDGFLGVVEAVAGGRGAPAYLIVRLRHRLRLRNLEIPATRIVSWSVQDALLTVDGSRRELLREHAGARVID